MAQESLKKQAQAKLVEARQLLKEAGKLAKEGGFVLTFNDGGTYIPNSVLVLENYRDEALKSCKKEGRYNRDGTTTPWKELSPEDQEEILQQTMRDFRSEEVPYQFMEYADEGDGDIWWSPSNC